jgi:hypothetical protein
MKECHTFHTGQAVEETCAGCAELLHGEVVRHITEEGEQYDFCRVVCLMEHVEVVAGTSLGTIIFNLLEGIPKYGAPDMCSWCSIPMYEGHVVIPGVEDSGVYCSAEHMEKDARSADIPLEGKEAV